MVLDTFYLQKSQKVYFCQFKPVLIADWFVVKLRVWHDCFSLSSETNQHLIVAGTHVRVSLVRRKKFGLGNL